jgi:hypothetical protein
MFGDTPLIPEVPWALMGPIFSGRIRSELGYGGLKRAGREIPLVERTRLIRKYKQTGRKVKKNSVRGCPGVLQTSMAGASGRGTLSTVCTSVP